MRRLICFILLSCALSGCATPVVIHDGNRSRVFTPCTADAFCFRDGYSVVWDNWCFNTTRDYPVSYRVKQSEYLSDRTEYILLPSAEARTAGGDL